MGLGASNGFKLQLSGQHDGIQTLQLFYRRPAGTYASVVMNLNDLLIDQTLTGETSIDQVGFALYPKPGHDLSGVFFSIRNSNTTANPMRLLNTAEHVTVRSFTDLLGVPKTTRYVCNTVSIRGTDMGSTLENGGAVSALRGAMGAKYWMSDDGDWYNAFAKVPQHSYNGRLAGEDGGFYAYAPQLAPEEQLYSQYGQALILNRDLHSRTSVAAYIKRDDASQSFRVRVCGHFELQTMSQQHPVKIPPLMPEWDLLRHGISTMAGAMENPQHKNVLKEAWNSFKNWIKKPSSWRTIATVGSTLVGALL
jgi:hypothetical protein